MFAVEVGEALTLNVTFTDSADNPVTPVSATWSVLDGDDDVLVPPTAIADVSGAGANITVPGAVHFAAGGYRLDVVMQTDSGQVRKSVVYGAFAPNRLEVLKNSFMTYQEAMFLAQDLPNSMDLQSADQAKQITCLINGFQRLTQLNYLVPNPKVLDDMDRIIPSDIRRLTPRMWPLMTLDYFNAYPPAFIKALKMAQVAEANHIATDDPIGMKRRAGLMSESIGESSMMFRVGPAPLDIGVSRLSLRYLTGYLDNRVVITRS